MIDSLQIERKSLIEKKLFDDKEIKYVEIYNHPSFFFAMFIIPASL